MPKTSSTKSIIALLVDTSCRFDETPWVNTLLLVCKIESMKVLLASLVRPHLLFQESLIQRAIRQTSYYLPTPPLHSTTNDRRLRPFKELLSHTLRSFYQWYHFLKCKEIKEVPRLAIYQTSKAIYSYLYDKPSLACLWSKTGSF